MNLHSKIALALSLGMTLASVPASAAPASGRALAHALEKSVDAAKGGKSGKGSKAGKKSKKADKKKGKSKKGGGSGADAKGGTADSSSAVQPPKNGGAAVEKAQDGVGAQASSGVKAVNGEAASQDGAASAASASPSQASASGAEASASSAPVQKTATKDDSPVQEGGERQPAPAATSSKRPWAEGVAPEEQRKALALFREGNGLLKDSLFGQAASKYREALSHWDHPAIHYNLVLALLNLDRPTEVLVHLKKAMAYGPEPIDGEKYEQARNYKVMVESQLAHLVIKCDLEGATVSMDGQELFTGPGRYEEFVRPGPHAIVAKKEGYVNNEVSPSLAPGQRGEYDMVLMTATEMTEYRRRWPVWRPWAVLGAGVVVAGVGAVLHVKGRQNISDYDDALNQSNTTLGTGEDLGGGSYDISGTSAGVTITADLDNKRTSGERLQKSAMVLYGVGGAAVVAGGVLLYMNRLKPYVPDNSASSGKSSQEGNGGTKDEGKVSFQMLPVVSPEGAGMLASFRF